MRFNEKLSRLMASRRMTQEALAAALDVSQPSVGRWISGSKPHRGTALLLAEFFGVAVEDLLDDGRELPLDRHLSELSAAARQVQEAYPSNPAAAEQAIDYLLLKRHQKEAAKRLEKVAAEISSIAKMLAGE